MGDLFWQSVTGILFVFWKSWKLFLLTLCFLLMLWSCWYGIKIECGDIKIELYGIGRFFK